MESYRIYKSLPWEDFLEDACYVLAKAGLYAIPIVQDIHSICGMKPQTDDWKKETLIERIRCVCERYGHKLERKVDFLDMGGYWQIYMLNTGDTFPATKETELERLTKKGGNDGKNRDV